MASSFHLCPLEISPSFSLNGMIITADTCSSLEPFLRARGVLERVRALDSDKLGLNQLTSQSFSHSASHPQCKENTKACLTDNVCQASSWDGSPWHPLKPWPAASLCLWGNDCTSHRPCCFQTSSHLWSPVPFTSALRGGQMHPGHNFRGSCGGSCVVLCEGSTAP